MGLSASDVGGTSAVDPDAVGRALMREACIDAVMRATTKKKKQRGGAGTLCAGWWSCLVVSAYLGI